MTWKHRRIVALGCLIGLGCGLYFLLAGGAGRVPPPPTVGELAIDGSVRPVHVSPVAARERVDASTHLSVTVVDRSGSPLDDVVAVFGEEHERRLDANRRDSWRTDRRGRMLIQGAAFPSSDSRETVLFFCHRRYRSVVVSRDTCLAYMSSDSGMEVVMDRGVSQTFSFRTWEGIPVRGHRILLTRSDHFPPDPMTRELEGGDASWFPSVGAGAVHSADSDAAGVATIHGLLPGEYRLRLEPRLDYAVKRVPDHGIVKVPSAAVDLELWPVYAGVVRFEGGLPDLYSVEFGSGTLQNGRTGQLESVAEWLERQFDNAKAWALIPSLAHDAESGATSLARPKIRWRAFTGGAWESGLIFLSRASEAISQAILIQADPRSGHATGRFSLEWPAEVPSPDIALQNAETGMTMPIRPGRTYSLPVGQYDLRASYPADRTVLPGIPFDLERDSDRSVSFPPDVVASAGVARITARLPDGSPASEAYLSAMTGGREVSGRLLGSDGVAVLVLEPGNYLVRITGRGLEPSEAPVEVLAIPSVTDFGMDLSWTANPK